MDKTRMTRFISMVNMKFIIAFIIGVIVLSSVHIICASEDSKILIHSEYMDSTDQKKSSTIIWEFISGDKKGQFDVYMKGDPNKILSLTYTDEGRLKSVTKWINDGVKKKEVKSEYNEKLVLSEGFPVPYDYLAPRETTLSRIKLMKHAGGASFSTVVTRQIEKISLKEAIELKIIDKNIASSINSRESNIELKLISVFKDTDLMVRQLWAEGEEFWIFEETPIRKSWKIIP